VSKRDLIQIKARLLLLAAAVPDHELQDSALGVLGPSELEGDCGQYLVSAPIEREPSQQ
jgi:hypothetical protein